MIERGKMKELKEKVERGCNAIIVGTRNEKERKDER
jgi:hypothetical protein